MTAVTNKDSGVILSPDPTRTNPKDLKDLTKTFKGIRNDSPLSYKWDALKETVKAVALIVMGILAILQPIGAIGLGIALISVGAVIGLEAVIKLYKAAEVEKLVDDASDHRLDATLNKINARNRPQLFEAIGSQQSQPQGQGTVFQRAPSYAPQANQGQPRLINPYAIRL